MTNNDHFIDIYKVSKSIKIKIKLRSFKKSEHINEKGVGHAAVSATKEKIEGSGIDAIKFKVPT